MHLPFLVRVLIILGVAGWYWLVRRIILWVDGLIMPVDETDKVFASAVAIPVSIGFGLLVFLAAAALRWVVTGD
jgi:hypothetical protein